MRLGRWAVLAIGMAAAACASTIGPVVPSIQVLVVLDSLDDTLRIIPVDSPDVMHKVLLGGTAAFNKHALALNGQIAAIGVGHAAYLFDIVRFHQICSVSIGTSDANPITSLTFGDNGRTYAAIPSTNTVAYFDGACAPGSLFVRGGPRAFVKDARSNLFVVTGDNSDTPSWLTTATGYPDPAIPLPLADSILLSTPGHAKGAVLGSDGLIYVINAGSGVLANARLSQVNPVTRAELNVIPGFGTGPQYIATDGADRILVTSAIEGLMVYNVRTNRVERSASSPIQLIGSPRGLIADDVGRVYAIIAGSCGAAPNSKGLVQVFGTDLVNTKNIPTGTCPVAIGVTDIPATLYNFPPPN